MSEPAIFFKEANERQGTYHRRTFMLGGITALGLTVLTGRLVQLQIVDAGRYKQLSAANQFNFRLLPPPRGRILDRNGAVIAGNRPSFRVLILRNETKDVDETLDMVARLLPQTQQRRRQLIREINQSPSFVPVAVATDLTWEEFSRVNLYAADIPGLVADMNEVRVYPDGGAFAHVIGYVAKVSEKDLEAVEKKNGKPDPILMHPGFRIGKLGVEKALDLELRGVPGAQKVEVDARGRVVAEDPEGGRPPVPGKDIMLTLDADIQKRALEVMGQEACGIVVMDVQTGDILCMASGPSFDANLFVPGIPSKTYRLLSEYERNPLLDKTISSLYPPGSTFKMTTALAILAAGVNPNERVVCTGSYRFGNRNFACWKRGGHGSQNLHEAIKNSCDVYFYHMSPRCGPDRIAEAAKALGFGQDYKIGIGGQRSGTVPTPAWKRENIKNDKRWQGGDTLNYSIGQGFLTANALQLAIMTARLANGRKAVVPRLIKAVGQDKHAYETDLKDLPFSQAHLDLVRAGMAAVANDTRGTAYRTSQLGLGDLKMAGKTGTAQVRNISRAERLRGVRSNESLQWRLRDHALYVAFAPHDVPRYAISVIVQHGGSGSKIAAPMAREVMKVVLLKDPSMRARIERPLSEVVEPETAVINDEPDNYFDEPGVMPEADFVPQANPVNPGPLP